MQKSGRAFSLIEGYLDLLLALQETIHSLQSGCQPLSSRAAEEFDKGDRQKVATPSDDSNNSHASYLLLDSRQTPVSRLDKRVGRPVHRIVVLGGAGRLHLLKRPSFFH